MARRSGIGNCVPILEDAALRAMAEKAGDSLLARVRKKLGKKGAVVDAAGGMGRDAMQRAMEGPEELYDAEDVSRAFVELVRFGYVPPPPQQGGAPGGVAVIGGQSVPLDSFQEQLAFLRDALQAYIDNPQEVGALMKQLQTARTTVQSLLGQLETGSGWRPRLEALTWPVIEHVSESLVGIKADIGRKWCSDVVATFVRTLGQRYPFAAREVDAGAGDVAAFFKPGGGVLWAFYGRELQGDLLRVGNTFRFDDRLGGMVRRAYSEGLAAYLQRAQLATNSLFAGGNELRMEFDVLINPSPAYGLIALQVGGEPLEYRGGPETWQHLVWPAGDPSQGAALRVRGRGGVEDAIRYPGDWALFRLIEAGTLVGQARGGSFRLSWTPTRFREPVIIEFRLPGGQSDLFTTRRRAGGTGVALKLGDLEPPAAITKGSPPCTPY